MKGIMLLAVVSLFLIGCKEGAPYVDNPSGIILNGKSYTQQEYLERFCTETSSDPECLKVSAAMGRDSAEFVKRKGW
jgi:hypothetical protein